MGRAGRPARRAHRAACPHRAHERAQTLDRAVREGKARGHRVTCEVAPHHFVADRRERSARRSPYDTNIKMNPPLREAADRDAMIAGLADGSVDVIATDHAPHHADEKQVEFDRAPFGIVGLETVVPLTFDRLVHAGVITLRAAGRAAVGESGADPAVPGRVAAPKARRPTSRSSRRTCRHHSRASRCGRSRRTRRSTAGRCGAASPRRSSAAARCIRIRRGRRLGLAESAVGLIQFCRSRDLTSAGTEAIPTPTGRDVSESTTSARRRSTTCSSSEVLMLDGHFDYGNGYHGRVVPQPASAVPPSVDDLALRAGPARRACRRPRAATEVVAGPVTGGALLAHTIAGLLDSRRSLTHPACSFAPFDTDEGGRRACVRFYASSEGPARAARRRCPQYRGDVRALRGARARGGRHGPGDGRDLRSPGSRSSTSACRTSRSSSTRRPRTIPWPAARCARPARRSPRSEPNVLRGIRRLDSRATRSAPDSTPVPAFDAADSVADPIHIVRRYSRPDDREIVAFFAAALAFGRVASVMQSVEALLRVLGPSPARVRPRLRSRSRTGPALRRSCTAGSAARSRWRCCVILQRMLESTARSRVLRGRRRCGAPGRRARRSTPSRRARWRSTCGPPTARRAGRPASATSSRGRRRQRLQAAEPVPALDGAPGRRSISASGRGSRRRGSSCRSTRTSSGLGRVCG